MKPVMLTKAQTDALIGLCNEVLASDPEDWGSSVGKSPREAVRAMDVIARAQAALVRSYPDAEGGA